MAQRELAAAWNTWIDHVQMQQKVRLAALKWLNKALSTAWESWHDWLHERRATLASAGKALLFWQNRAVAACWVRWVEAIAHRNEMRAKLAGALRRMAQRELAAAWNAWKVKILEARAAANAGAALKHWANRHLSSAFRTWTHWQQSQRSHVRATELALAFWMHGMMRNWWERWLQYVSDCIKEKAASIYCARSLSKSVFAAWCFHVQHEARAQHELREFSLAFGDLKLKQRIFKKWVNKSEHGMLAKTGLMFHSRRRLIRGFEAWRVFSVSSAEERAFKYRLEALLGIGDAYSNFRRYMSPIASPRTQ